MGENIGEDLELVVRSIRRTRNKLGCGFLLCLGIGIGFIAGGIFSEEAKAAMIILGAICVLLALVGAKIVWPNLDPENAPLVRLLRERPENIAWVYSAVDPGSGGVWGRTMSVTVNDVDKQAYTFTVKAASSIT